MKEMHHLRSLAGMIGLIALCGCGSSSTGPNPQPSSTPPPTPAPTPTPFATLCGSPSPAPFAGMKVKVQTAVNSTRWLLDSRPQVYNVDGYCGKVGGDNRAKQCDTRPEGNAQREACDALVVGKSRDTGRVGPTWTDPDGKPCVAAGDTGSQLACINTENQFLVVARGEGQFLACASEDWPLGDGGSRCGGCTLKAGFLICG